MGIPNACLWLKANDGGLIPGSTVSIWQDRSRNGKDMTGVGNPSVVAGSNTTGMNFNPVVGFNGVDQGVKRDDSTIGTDVSEVNIFFVNRTYDKTIRFAIFFSHGGDSPRMLIHWTHDYFPDTPGHQLKWDHGLCCNNPSTRNSSFAPFAGGTPNLGLVTNSVMNRTAEIVVNARTLDDTDPPSPGVRLTGTYLERTLLGGGILNIADEPHHGDISEFLEFKHHLDATQRTRVQSYLALKYGLTLDRNGLKDKAYTSGNDASVYSDGGYWHSIIGIGYDTRTGLDQRISRSMQKIGSDPLWVASGDSPLTIATTPEFTSANGGTRRRLDPGQYLVLGDNNGALDALSADALGQRGNRIPRVWLAQNTLPRISGEIVTAVFLGFDPAPLPASLATEGYLLVSSDANFSAATTARYPLNLVNLGGKVFLTPVVKEGSSTPGAVVMLPGASYISLGQSSAQLCTGSAMGIADACAWYRADRGLDANHNWPDQSGAGNSARVNGSPSLTPNSVNFNATVDYRGGAGHTLPATADVINRYTFLGLARMAGTHNGRVFSDRFNNRIFGYWGGPRPKQDVWTDVPGYLTGGNFGNYDVYVFRRTEVVPQTRPMLYTLRHNDDDAASFKSNGRTLIDTRVGATSKYRVALANGGTYFEQADDYADVSIPEFFSFKRALSDAEIDRIESYLALKYGFTLGSAAEPKNYVNSENQAVWTANRAYQHRVFGLGRDSHATPNNSTTLDQRVSKSTDHTLDDTRSSILTIATTPEFTSANGGTRRRLDPGQYLVLGDNNGALDALSADALGQRGNRIPRVWLAQNTLPRISGEIVTAVFLGFDPAPLPASLATEGYLLVSSDANFSAATTARYPLNLVNLGGKVFLTPVVKEGSSTPGAVVMLPGASYISLGQSSAQLCTGSAMGIADACAWYRADRGLDANHNWPDQSGAGNSARVNGSPSLTPNSVNFNATVDYRGGAGHTLPATADVINRYTFLGLARMVGTHNGRVFSDRFNNRIFGYWGGPRPKQDVWTDVPGYLTEGNFGNYDVYVFRRTEVVPQTRPMLYTLRHNDDDAASFKSNGRTLIDTRVGATSKYRVALANGGTYFEQADDYADVSIPEFFSFKRALSDAEIDRIESYLALKYGFTLGTAAEPRSYVNNTNQAVWTANSGYQHRVFGLGRDGGSQGLDQRVSKSTDHTLDDTRSSILTIATSADFTSANPGGRTELGDGQYLVLGDNNGALDALSASAMGRDNNRLPRVWRAQNTGVRSVFLGLEAAKVSLTDTGRLYLFVESGAGADGSFPADRTHAYALSNTLTDLTGYWVPVAVGAPLAVNIPNDGAYLSYGTLTEPQLSLTVQSRGKVGTFRFSGTNGFVASSATTRAEMQPVAADPATQTLSAPDVDIVITVTMPEAGWRLESGSCIDRRAAASGNPSGAVLGRVSASDKFTIPAAQAKASADLHCALVARYDSGSTLKTVSGRVFIDNGAGGGVANDGKINGAETGRSGAALSLTNCGSGGTTIYAYTSSSGDGHYSLKVPPTVTNGPMCIAQTLIDDYRVTQGGLEATGADASGVTLDTTAAQSNRWRFTYAGASVQNLHIGNVPSSRLLVDGTRVGIAGSTVDFPHRLIAGTAGTLAFGVSDASPAASGWSEVLYRDANCNAQLDAGEPLLGGSPTAVAADAPVCVIVRQFVPAGLYEGATRQFQLQATLNWANAAPRSETLTNRDHTQVSGQALRLYKEVRNVTADERSGTGHESWTTSNSAKPGETLEYRTTFTNLAPEPITKLEIYDATPNYTTLVSADCPAPLSLPAGLTCEPLSTTASPPTKPIDGGTGPLRWRFNGPLPGGAAGAVKYRVKVNE